MGRLILPANHSMSEQPSLLRQKQPLTPNPNPPPAPPWLLLQREAAPDEDPAQRVCLASHGHWRTDLQVPKGIQAGDSLKEWLPGHIAKVWALGRGNTPVVSPPWPGALSPSPATL